MRRTSEKEAKGAVPEGGLSPQCMCSEVSKKGAGTGGTRSWLIDPTLASPRAAVGDSAATRNMPSCVLQL
jgi:hypothetical protein